MPTVIREIKLAANDRVPIRTAENFAVKVQVADLFREFDRLKDGTVLVLEVKHGLPFRMTLDDAVEF